MRKWQIGLLVALAVILLAAAIIFWGSIMSGMCLVSLPLIPGVIMYRKLWLDRKQDDFDDLDPIKLSYRKHFETIGNEEQED